MKKFHILLIVLFGFFMMPNTTFACGNSDRGSCTMEMSSKTKKKECCSKDSHSKSSKHKGCNGKCGQALCSSSSVNTAIPSAFQFEMQNSNFKFSTEKQKFYQTVSFTSAGYSSLWLIPKIG
ncbi:hypothetical protein HNP99_000281 [Flavobacterium sp. 28A]|uniref:hypothetical protein n=1 Tax=Flavobacterium sp. 28A TaxID=2735895 RepID=UPI0015704CF9|nr:hypothetical protein [Flavobacterium sp. 28A]NRT13956.1 hypothetical protein [Flavobacterium sp. 28A]